MPEAAATLQRRLRARTATVAVVGLGYVGLPVTAAMVEAGFTVLGVDVDPVKVGMLQRGEPYLRHLGEDFLPRLLGSGRFSATADHGRLGEADAILICVPTPLLPDDAPDLSHVVATGKAVAATLRAGQLVVLESTTFPGTTRQVLAPLLEATGLRCGVDVFVAFAPEREDPGRHLATRDIPRLVGGLDDLSRDLAVLLYEAAVATVVPVSSAEVAEAAKLLENVYRAVNIALVNELKVILHALGVDPLEVVEAAATKPFGFQSFRPGPGLGGHCIPVDPFYLSWVARRAGVPARFVELAGQVNRAMPGYVVQRTEAALAARGVALAGASLLVVGLAYKADVDDVRGSPAFVLLERLLERGARVQYHDPHVPQAPPVRHARLPPLASVPLDPERVAAYDAVIVATDHRAIDWDLLARSARLIVDTRGALRGRRREDVVDA